MNAAVPGLYWKQNLLPTNQLPASIQQKLKLLSKAVDSVKHKTQEAGKVQKSREATPPPMFLFIRVQE